MPETHYALRTFMALGLLSLTGCTAVGPDYHEPSAGIPDDWHTDTSASFIPATTAPAELTAWWTLLNDPALTALIERAVGNGIDVRSALARLREARARRDLAASALYPTIDAVASASRNDDDAITDNIIRERYVAALDAGWEVDIFGSNRRALEAARADLGASEAALRDVMVSLAAEVALVYVELRTLQSRLDITRAELQTRQQTHDLTRWRYEAGLTTALDVEQAQASLQQTRAQLAVLERSLRETEHRLSVLLALPPGSLWQDLRNAGPIPAPPLHIAVGIPADTLRQRPDVRQAERQLTAQTARLGEAMAAAYPSFNLQGSIGLNALQLDDLLDSRTTTSILASAVAPIFNAGRIRQNIAVQDALLQQARLNYERSILLALQEVEDALVGFVQNQHQREALAAAAASARLAADLAEQQYVSGLTDFQTVLDTQRTFLSLQDQLAVSEGDVVASLIQLYKALGGGWNNSDIRS